MSLHPTAMRKLPTFAVVLLVGCGGTEPDLPSGDTFVSGTRLRAVYLDGGDGAVVLDHWHDLELDITCQFAEAPDGQVRCLPDTLRNLGYRDAACQEPLVLPEPDLQPMIATRSPGCPGSLARARPFLLGEQRVMDATFRRDYEGTCVPWLPSGVEMIELVEVDPTSFVRASLATVGRDGGGGSLVVRGDDGSYDVLAAVDDQGSRCRVVEDGVCVPDEIPVVTGALFGDASCARPVGGVELAPDCPAPTRGRAYSLDSCAHTGVLAMGGEVDPDVLFLDEGEACAPVTAQPESRYFEVADASLSPFFPVDVVDVGTGRLRRSQVVNTAGVILGPRRLWLWRDTQLDVDCYEQDGRCFPEEEIPQIGGGYFADEVCTQPLYFAAETTCGPSDIPTWVRRTADLGATVSVHPVGDAHTGPIYEGSATTCQAVTQLPPGTFHRVGPASSLDVLAPMVEVTD